MIQLTMTRGKQAISQRISVMLCRISKRLLCHIVRPVSTMCLLGAALKTVPARGVSALPCKHTWCPCLCSSRIQMNRMSNHTGAAVSLHTTGSSYLATLNLNNIHGSSPPSERSQAQCYLEAQRGQYNEVT